MPAVSAPILHAQPESIASENPAPPSTYSSHIPTSTCGVQALAKIDAAAILPQTKSTPGSSTIEPSTPSESSVVWAKALEIIKKRLSDNSLPPLDLTSLISQSAEENIAVVVKELNAAQGDNNRKRRSYTRQLGKILKSVEKYTKVVDTAIQSNPQVSALVWAGILAIMRVRIGVLSLGVDSILILFDG